MAFSRTKSLTAFLFAKKQFSAFADCGRNPQENRKEEEKKKKRPNCARAQFGKKEKEWEKDPPSRASGGGQKERAERAKDKKRTRRAGVPKGWGVGFFRPPADPDRRGQEAGRRLTPPTDGVATDFYPPKRAERGGESTAKMMFLMGF